MEHVPCVRFEESEIGSALIVSFSAAIPSHRDSGFAFPKTLAPVAADKLFLVDPFRALYMRGVPGVGHDFWEIAGYVKEVRDRRKSCRVITMGHSAGGFAALVTGAILGVDRIHAFNPPTSLMSENLFRDKTLFRRCRVGAGRNRDISDVAEIVSTYMPRTTLAYVHYSLLNALDRKRSRLLEGLPNIHLVTYPVWEHNLARYLARSGAITRLLETSVHGNEEEMRAVIRQHQVRAITQLPWSASTWVSRRAMGLIRKPMNPPPRDEGEAVSE